MSIDLALIGGTGLYQFPGLENVEKRAVETPWGAPSGPVVLGELRGRRVAFLARHGANHERLPGEINFRANVWALKSVGVRTIVGVSATGSLREGLKPGDLALPSQYLDFTRGQRAASFFGNGVVAHVSTAHPACAATSRNPRSASACCGLRSAPCTRPRWRRCPRRRCPPSPGAAA